MQEQRPAVVRRAVASGGPRAVSWPAVTRPHPRVCAASVRLASGCIIIYSNSVCLSGTSGSKTDRLGTPPSMDEDMAKEERKKTENPREGWEERHAATTQGF